MINNTSDLSLKAERVFIQLLSNDLNRSKHTRTVVHLCHKIANQVNIDAEAKELLIASAYLHDIGYSPVIADTGFYPYDGYIYLKENNWPDELCQLVLRHSQAHKMGDLIPPQVERLYEQGIDSRIHNIYKILCIADMMSDTNGRIVTFGERYYNILASCGKGSTVTKHAAKLIYSTTNWVTEFNLKL